MKVKLILLISFLMILSCSYFNVKSYALNVNDFPFSLYGLPAPSPAQISYLTAGGRNHISLIKGFFNESGTIYRLVSTTSTVWQGDNQVAWFEKFITRYENGIDTRYYEWNGTSWFSGYTGVAIWNENQILVSNMNIYNTFTGTKKYSTPTTQIPNQEEFIYITNPPQGFKTIDKFIKYTVNYSISTQDVNNLIIQIRNQDGIPLEEDLKVKSFYIDSQEATQEGNFNKGIISIVVEYENIVGAVGITATILNSDTDRQLQLVRNCQLYDFTDSDGDGVDDITGEDEFHRDEMIVIAAPKLNEKTVNRMVPLNFYIRIKGDNYNTILQNTKIFYKNSVSGQYEDIFLSEILNDTNVHINNKNQLRLFNFYKVGEYITLNFTCNLLFEDTFLGDIPLRISTTSDTTGKQITVFHKFTIVAFIDANNDGIDDNTGEVYDPNPQLPDYSDDELTLDGAIGTLKNVIPFLQGALSSIIIIITVLFGWLPPEIMFLITAIVTLIGVSVIVKIIRG